MGEVLNGKFGQSFVPEDLAYMLRQFSDGSDGGGDGGRPTQVQEMQGVLDGAIGVVAAVLSGEVEPKVQARGATHFQIYRGETGHSV